MMTKTSIRVVKEGEKRRNGPVAPTQGEERGCHVSHVETPYVELMMLFVYCVFSRDGVTAPLLPPANVLRAIRN